MLSHHSKSFGYILIVNNFHLSNVANFMLPVKMAIGKKICSGILFSQEKLTHGLHWSFLIQSTTEQFFLQNAYFLFSLIYVMGVVLHS